MSSTAIYGAKVRAGGRAGGRAPSTTLDHPDVKFLVVLRVDKSLDARHRRRVGKHLVWDAVAQVLHADVRPVCLERCGERRHLGVVNKRGKLLAKLRGRVRSGLHAELVRKAVGRGLDRHVRELDLDAGRDQPEDVVLKRVLGAWGSGAGQIVEDKTIAGFK